MRPSYLLYLVEFVCFLCGLPNVFLYFAGFLRDCFSLFGDLGCSVTLEGFVVANDSDNKRCYLMVHQVRRLASSNFLVMNMDASILPAFTVQVMLLLQ